MARDLLPHIYDLRSPYKKKKSCWNYMSWLWLRLNPCTNSMRIGEAHIIPFPIWFSCQQFIRHQSISSNSLRNQEYLARQRQPRHQVSNSAMHHSLIAGSSSFPSRSCLKKDTLKYTCRPTFWMQTFTVKSRASRSGNAKPTAPKSNSIINL